MHYRQTLAKTVAVRGIGLHSGKTIEMRLVPAEAGTGILFVREDAGGIVIPATLDYAGPSFYATVITRDGASVSTIESTAIDLSLTISFSFEAQRMPYDTMLFRAIPSNALHIIATREVDFHVLRRRQGLINPAPRRPAGRLSASLACRSASSETRFAGPWRPPSRPSRPAERSPPPARS